MARLGGLLGGARLPVRHRGGWDGCLLSVGWLGRELDFVETEVGGVEEVDGLDAEDVSVLAELAAGGDVSWVGRFARFHLDDGLFAAELDEEVGADFVLGDAAVDVHLGSARDLAVEDLVALLVEPLLGEVFAEGGAEHAVGEEGGLPGAAEGEGEPDEEEGG